MTNGLFLVIVSWTQDKEEECISGEREAKWIEKHDVQAGVAGWGGLAVYKLIRLRYDRVVVFGVLRYTQDVEYVPDLVAAEPLRTWVS